MSSSKIDRQKIVLFYKLIIAVLESAIDVNTKGISNRRKVKRFHRSRIMRRHTLNDLIKEKSQTSARHRKQIINKIC